MGITSHINACLCGTRGLGTGKAQHSTPPVGLLSYVTSQPITVQPMAQQISTARNSCQAAQSLA
jgi:hypothetical protein